MVGAAVRDAARVVRLEVELAVWASEGRQLGAGLTAAIGTGERIRANSRTPLVVRAPCLADADYGHVVAGGERTPSELRQRSVLSCPRGIRRDLRVLVGQGNELEDDHPSRAPLTVGRVAKLVAGAAEGAEEAVSAPVAQLLEEQ